jgi:type VI secretion system protein ImpF
LDRLLDDEPELSRETAKTRTQVLRELKQTIRRELENLLNTRRYCRPLPPGLSELETSLANYGLPDITGAELGLAGQREQFRQTLEDVIRRFEPRFATVAVEMLDNVDTLDRTLRFRIDAMLHAEPAPEPIVFDLAMQPTAGTLRFEEPGDERRTARITRELAICAVGAEFAERIPRSPGGFGSARRRRGSHVERLIRRSPQACIRQAGRRQNHRCPVGRAVSAFPGADSVDGRGAIRARPRSGRVDDWISDRPRRTHRNRSDRRRAVPLSHVLSGDALAGGTDGGGVDRAAVHGALRAVHVENIRGAASSVAVFCQGVDFRQAGDRPPAFLPQGAMQHVYALYELLFNNVLGALAASPRIRPRTRCGVPEQVGFDREQGMIPISPIVRLPAARQYCVSRSSSSSSCC